ncbi:MAG: hypothetical protein WCK26_01075 [Candidatus Saccharibacteria bacterium]
MEEIDKPVKTVKKSNTKKILIISVAVVLVVTVAGLHWWLYKTDTDADKKQDDKILSLEKSNSSLTSQLAEEKLKNKVVLDGPEITLCPNLVIGTSLSDNVQASITSGNTAALEGYMADSVNVILAATEGIGPSTPTAAVSAITSFISDATSPWNFALPAATLTKYSSGGYTQYFPTNAEVGKSANGKVISFKFNCDSKIETVFMSVSDELL